MRKKYKLGQSLIEVVVIMGIVVMAAIALVSTSLFTQRTARTANAQIQATKLAEQAVEELRIIRDRKGFTSLKPAGPSSCLINNSQDSDPASWSVSCWAGAEETITLSNVAYKRRMIITNDSSNRKKVTVTVSWDEPGGTKTVSHVTFFSDF